MFLTFLRSKWLIIGLAAIVLVGGFLLTKKQEETFITQLSELRKTQEAEIQKIQNARIQEQKDREKAEKDYQSAIIDISKRYSDALQALEKAKKDRIQEILKYNDPTVLAQQLAATYDFRVVP